jgi:TIGR03009 family protein
MRTIGVTAVLVAVGSVATAQGPGVQPAGRVPTPGAGQGVVTTALQPPAAPDPQVVAHLKAWEAKMAGLQNLYTKCEVTREEAILKKKKTLTGEVVCMKPNFARMRIDSTIDPKDWEAYVCDGKVIYAFDGLGKVIKRYKIPAGNNGAGDNLLMEFMSGSLTADGALRRFDVKILAPNPPQPDYLFFEIKPRQVRDKQEFEVLKLVLFSPTIRKDLQQWAYLPRMVVMTKNNNEQIETWQFPEPRPDVPGYLPKHFQVDQLPGKDWKVVDGDAPAPATGQPRVARPTGPGK